jgi:sensor histidine kinase YesM
MDSRWTIFFQQLRKKTLWQIVFWLPATTVFFALLNYISANGSETLNFIFLESAIYSICIQGSLFFIFTVYWAVLTSIGDKGIKFAKRRLIAPYILLSIVGGGGGILMANYSLAFIRNDAPKSNYLLLNTFFVASIISIAITYYQAYRYTKTENRELEANTIEAQYLTLKHQLQPHFLFNSLNSLGELIEENPSQATHMTERLANLYRSILANSKNKTSSLESEIDIVRTYLDLEILRFGERLRYSMDLPNHQPVLYLPSLMLQTLVENAVKHGIAPSINGGDIDLRVLQLKNGFFRIVISNGGCPFKNSSGSGTGLPNTIKRLDLMYGGLHNFSIGRGDQDRTVVSFNFTGAQIV